MVSSYHFSFHMFSQNIVMQLAMTQIDNKLISEKVIPVTCGIIPR